MLLDAEQVKPLYIPSHDKPMHVVVFGSGSGTNLEALLRAPSPSYKIVTLFTDRKCRFGEIGRSAGIPVITHYYVKERYDEETRLLLLAEAERGGFSIDLILLAGYMRIVRAPLLKQFHRKIVNIHPADLTKLTSDGKRAYVGAHAVRDALLAGEHRTRSSVILVDEGVDTGPILGVGPWVEYEEGYPVTEERVARHQEKQKTQSDWPVCREVVEKIACGRL